ncbi:sentrin-specific protease 5 [Oryzias melastigma]|uniref:sentrin-specific protease 5 n=1 Tax=Oryzias melastigma TaxID=30732 RepID=UPI000CF81730|nr:sentrin-specific protease 5 [Oryzias melastigma]XP_024130024.1 sentrin-specific protease 5 [Oryzias melastigma]XP_036072143.1 sentrin-specific protease 5 [Oryzias melastigma]
MQKKNRKKTESLKRQKKSLDNGTSHLSKRDRRRLHLKWRLFVWRCWRQKFRFFRGQRTGSGLGFSWRSHTNNLLRYHETRQNSQVINTVWSESDSLPEEPTASTVSVSQNTSPTVTQRHSEDVTALMEAVTPLQQKDSNTWETQKARTPEDKGPLELHSSVHSSQNQNPNDAVCLKKVSSCQTDIDPDTLTRAIQDFLDSFYRRYGSFIPLRQIDILNHLKAKFNSDFSNRKTLILSAAARYQSGLTEMPVSQFQIIYKKHILTLEDLLTLADQNWLNDQVMNMYGELIMEASHHKVHFLNSFFHRQLMTKGYEGVKRWTKQVDLFSKSILLVPVHLEVHWCLVTADVASKKICLYDSQGNALQKVARNILKYLITEAKAKQQSAYESGWTVSFDEKIPQQTNENDCGVFVLEYSRCLALSRPFQFTQKDIPKIRKRIYKELCDCKLQDQD